MFAPDAPWRIVLLAPTSEPPSSLFKVSVRFFQPRHYIMASGHVASLWIDAWAVILDVVATHLRLVAGPNAMMFIELQRETDEHCVALSDFISFVLIELLVKTPSFEQRYLDLGRSLD